MNGNPDALSNFISKVTTLILQPIVELIFALALFYFFYQVVVFIARADNPDARKKGQQQLLWGIIGLFIMASVIGILAAVTLTFCGTAFCK